MLSDRSIPRQAAPRLGYTVACAAILFLALISSLPLITGQFQGSDEARQYEVTAPILAQIMDWRGLDSLAEISRVLTRAYHPPLRYLMSAVGLLIAPDSELGLRLLSILASLVMTAQVIGLGRDLGGPATGLVSGLLVACSAVFNWTSMAFGWSVVVTMLLISARDLRRASFDLSDPTETRRFYRVNLALMTAFLMNTGNILFVIMAGLLYWQKNHPRYRLLVARYLPVGAFYAAYYLFVMVLAVHFSEAIFGQHVTPGQYSKNQLRAGSLHPNVQSLLENVQGLNAYFFPVLGVLLVAAALVYLWKFHRRLLVWMAPHLLMWSFVFSRSTQQYIILAAIVLVPFAVQWAHDRLGARGMVTAGGVAALLFGAWNASLFIRTYTADAYPGGAMRDFGYAWAERHHNVPLPFEAIGRDLDALLAPGETYSDDISGSFSLYYHAHPSYAGRLGTGSLRLVRDPAAGCERLPDGFKDTVRAVVTDRVLCAGAYDRVTLYDGSGIRLYVLPPRGS